jgi:4-hydroxybenzoate polyprenyltransferase
MRPAQWLKNMFVFLPLIFGKKLFVYPFNLNAVIAFTLFCIASSAAYMINDVIDIRKDKVHPAKRLRPISSGKVSPKLAVFTALILGILSVIFSFALNVSLGWVIVIYCVFNLIYSVSLKDVVIIDVFCIGVFFLLRLLAGSIAAGVYLSHWIVIMTGLLAMFLGFNKRRQELVLFERKAVHHRRVLEHYDPYFIDQMIAVITSSIVIAYTLYTVDARTIQEFGSKHLMYTIPFVYYGIFRYLYLIHKIRRDGDPTRVFLLDKIMQLNVVLWVVVCIFVIYLGY